VNKAPTILQMAIRLLGVVVLVLGIVLWGGHADSLRGGHEALAILLVVCLWALAALAAKAGVGIPLVAAAVVWGLIAPILGFAQLNIDHGNSAPIKVLHLLVGLGVIGFGEVLGARLKKAQ
jgi:uncharacterized membrane protein